VKLSGEGGSPLAKCEKFVTTTCPGCGGRAKRETDTMDTFMESSWYMLRYASPHYDQGPVDAKMIEYWLPIDQYIGGIEHAVGHLIYFRYYTKLLRDLGYINLDEPCKNLMTQGMVYKDGAKMSKSKGNVVDPDDMIAKYGADTMRIFSLFAAPPEKDLEWNDQGVEGSYRFLVRVWRLVTDFIAGELKLADANDEMKRFMHKTIKKVTCDIERFHFNTAIASIMEWVNFLYGRASLGVDRQSIERLVLMTAPFAPHLAEELWKVFDLHGICGRQKRILHKRVFAGHAHKRCAKEGVGSGGKNPDFLFRIFNWKIDIGALASPYPFLLHELHAFRPTRKFFIQIAQKLFGIIGNAKIPLRHGLHLYGAIASPAGTRYDLFVGQNRITGRTPIDLRSFFVGYALLEKFGKNLLFPAIIIRIAGGELSRPIVGKTKPL
jgi:hypothetical protein